MSSDASFKYVTVFCSLPYGHRCNRAIQTADDGAGYASAL